MTAFRLLSFMYALNMEVLYKMNSEQNKKVQMLNSYQSNTTVY
jgi:hypothetical protein